MFDSHESLYICIRYMIYICIYVIKNLYTHPAPRRHWYTFSKRTLYSDFLQGIYEGCVISVNVLFAVFFAGAHRVAETGAQLYVHQEKGPRSGETKKERKRGRGWLGKTCECGCMALSARFACIFASLAPLSVHLGNTFNPTTTPPHQTFPSE